MAKYSIYKLHFTAPLHLGDRREDYGTSQKVVSSDTFYAALTACLAKMGYDIPADGDLGVAISSLFPYYQKDDDDDDEKAVFFLPSPLLQPMPKLNDIGKAKKVKKVKWLDVSLFERILAGEELFNNNDGMVASVQGDYLTTSSIDKDFIHSQVAQRVEVSRKSGEDAMPFYMDKVFFKGKSGLYFIAAGDTRNIDKAMPMLAMEGIGTDRNVGNGCFEYSKEEIVINIPNEAHHAVSLSMFFPESQEQITSMLDGEDVAYDMERRGGWITSPGYNKIRKNVIYGLTPGSVVKYDINETIVLGKTVDLSPNIPNGPQHPVWRCGKAIFLPITIK